MTPSDSEIIERVRSGETRAYALLITRYQDKGFALAMRMLRKREDAEEALQDAFVRAFKSIAQFRGTAAFGTWFYRILYNVCLTGISRRNGESSGVAIEEVESLEGITEATTASMEEQIERSDILEAVVRTMDRLPEKYGTILHLFYLQDLSHAEICGVMSLPLGTVKTQLNRARLLLQRELLKEFSTEGVL